MHSSDETSARFPTRLAEKVDKKHSRTMASVPLSEFGNALGDYLAAAPHEAVEITAPNAERRAVLVSPAFFDRAMQALEDQDDIHAAAEARKNPQSSIAHDDLAAQLGL